MTADILNISLIRAEPIGTLFKQMANAPVANINGKTPLAFHAANGRYIKIGILNSASNQTVIL